MGYLSSLTLYLEHGHAEMLYNTFDSEDFSYYSSNGINDEGETAFMNTFRSVIIDVVLCVVGLVVLRRMDDLIKNILEHSNEIKESQFVDLKKRAKSVYKIFIAIVCVQTVWSIAFVYLMQCMYNYTYCTCIII